MTATFADRNHILILLIQHRRTSVQGTFKINVNGKSFMESRAISLLAVSFQSLCFSPKYLLISSEYRAWITLINFSDIPPRAQPWLS